MGITSCQTFQLITFWNEKNCDLLDKGVDCRDSSTGPVCGPCPYGYKGNGNSCVYDLCKNNPCYPGNKSIHRPI